MESLERTLSALKDVRGVEGSFYASRDGRILGRDLPRIFDGDPLDGVATRVARLLEAMGELPGEYEGALLRYPSHALFLRPTSDGMLCVLATSEVNVPSLKRGASLVARRLPSLPPLPNLDEATRATLPPLPVATGGASALPSPPRAPALPPPLPPTRSTAPPARTSAPTPARASVPGAPASPAMRWRGSSLKDG